MPNTRFNPLYYRHSGRFSGFGALKALVLGALVALPLGAAYAYADLYNPIAGWVTFLLTGGTGYLMGWIGAGFIKSGKIRNVPLAMLIAACLAGVMFLSSWEVWIYALYQHAGNPVPLFALITHPADVWRIVLLINAQGAWTLDKDTPTGIVLGAIWLIEAGALLGIPLWLAWTAVHEFPFCEQCNQWCASRDLLNLKPGDKSALRAQLEARDFSALAALGMAPPTAMHFSRAYLQGCAGCDSTQTLCVDEQVLTVGRNGKLRTRKTPIISRLVLTPEDTVAVATAIAALSAAAPAPDAAAAVPALETSDPTPNP